MISLSPEVISRGLKPTGRLFALQARTRGEDRPPFSYPLAWLLIHYMKVALRWLPMKFQMAE